MPDHIFLYDDNNCLHSPDENTPATVHASGEYQAYYKHGVLHRITGPAVVRVKDGKQQVEHWVLGSFLSEAAFEKLVNGNVNLSHETALRHSLQQMWVERFPPVHRTLTP